MKHLDEARSLGGSFRNLTYAVDQLEAGRNLVSLEALVVAVLLGLHFRSWTLGGLAWFGILVLLSTSGLLRKVWSVLFSVVLGGIAAALGWSIGMWADKSAAAAIGLAVVAGLLTFATSLVKHGWGFRAMRQDFERGREEGQSVRRE